jgi:hypothetical protein
MVKRFRSMSSVTRRFALCGISAVTVGLLASGCVVAPRHAIVETSPVVVYSSPPPLREEVVPPPPNEQVVWEPGHWRWDGHDWQWLPGHYETRPYAEAVWIPGHWAERNGGWVWVAGHWRERQG